MRTTNRHIIERINFEATMPEANYGTQQALGSWLREVACPAIARACDELLPEGAYLRLEELEIDLGLFPTLDVDIPRDRNLLTDQLVRQLREVLADHFLKVQHEERLLKSTADYENAGLPAALGTRETKPDPTEGALNESAANGGQANEERRFEQWLYFLEHGCLPWWGGAFPASEAWAKSLAETVVKQSTARTRLLNLVMRSRIARQRLAADRRHEAAFTALLAAAVTPRKAWESWVSLGEALARNQKRFITKLPTKLAWRQVGKESWWEMLLREETDVAAVQRSVNLVVASFFPGLPERSLQAVVQRLVSNASVGEENARPKKMRRGIKGEADVMVGLFLAAEETEHITEPGDKSKAEHTNMASPEEHPDPTLPFKTDLEPAAAPPKTDQEAPKESTAEPAPNHWYVRHAGLVLVHPFLEPLFAGLGYWQDGSFADELARQRAVYLTHYLATGDPAGQEEDLVLPKLLCGWPVSGVPVVLTEPLTTTELHEADEVLRAIIGHWPAIGEASPDGLREGFFAREARLLRRENDWELTVERKGQDILLGRLAWGISMVRCVWHEVFIKVVW